VELKAREVDECPACRIKGEPVSKDLFVETEQECGYFDWRCPQCTRHWDRNDDFKCCCCGKEVPGWILWCRAECEDRDHGR